MIPVSKPSLGKKELELIEKVFDSNWMGLGSYVIAFEEKIKEFTGAAHAIATNSGTAALHLSLEASGISGGDEVVVPSLTFAATVQAVTALGARPVFCEVIPETLCIDPEDAAKRITGKTKAIIPVHYCGIAAKMDKIIALGTDYNLAVVEDAAHAFGSSFIGTPIGTHGTMTCFSFDPIKNITCGEGGIITTSDNGYAELIRKKRILGIDNDGWSRHKQRHDWSYKITTQGYRYHMSNINAAIGLAQFERLEYFRHAKSNIVKRYNTAFSNIEEISTLHWDLENTFPFIYIIRVPAQKRNDLKIYLEKKGIETGIHYIPNHLHPYFENGQKLPVTEKLFGEIITLPLFVDMTDHEVELVIESVKKFFKR
jgi:dTDP-4-amino-4,6-dideoxygalactose transaminase